MDVIKVFTEEPVGLEALVPDDAPDARRREAPAGSLEALLEGLAAPYARAYLAGTRLPAADAPRRVGLTALDGADPWVRPLLTWAGDRPWSALRADGTAEPLSPSEAAVTLRGVSAKALAVGPAPADALAEAAAAPQRRDRLDALRAVLDAGATAFFPEPAFDGVDWSVFSRAPLRDPLAAAFREHPAPVGVRRFVAPYRRARGEHTFYFEQWALDDLPDWAEEM